MVLSAAQRTSASYRLKSLVSLSDTRVQIRHSGYHSFPDPMHFWKREERSRRTGEDFTWKLVGALENGEQVAQYAKTIKTRLSDGAGSERSIAGGCGSDFTGPQACTILVERQKWNSAQQVRQLGPVLDVSE